MRLKNKEFTIEVQVDQQQIRDMTLSKAKQLVLGIGYGWKQILQMIGYSGPISDTLEK